MLSAIVLAAGTSSRMGTQNKLLLPWKDQTVIETVVAELLNAQPGEVVVVVGHEKDSVRKVLTNRDVTFVENPAFQQGMATSLVAGIRASHVDTEGFMICLGDLPMIQATDYQGIIGVFEVQKAVDPDCILIPAYEGKWGHPKVFSAKYRAQLMKPSGDQGAKDVLKASAAHIHEIPFSHDRILRDIDTDAAYQAARRKNH